LPPARDAASVKECYRIAVRMNEEAKKRVKAMDSLKGNFWRPIYVDEIDKDILEAVVQFSVCHISPIAAFLGGIAAQEVIKYTGKFLPLHQWYYFDAMELLPCQKKTVDGTII
jgi:ubiquitin-activating enzyme E1